MKDGRVQDCSLAALGLPAESRGVDSVASDLVVYYALGGLEELGGLHAISASRFERILDEILFVGIDGFLQRSAHSRARRFGGLESGRQVMAMYDVAVTDQHGPLDGVFQLSNIARPVITHQHIYRWS